MKRLVPISFAFLFMALTSDAFARRSGLMVVEKIVAFEIRVVSLPPSPDFSGNGVVGLEDFFAFAEVYGSVDGDGIYQAKFDLSRNGSIGFEDFFIFAESFGMEVGTSSPPPDPPAGLAPADQAAFDSLAVGKQIVAQGSDDRLVFLSPGRIRELFQGESYDGDYQYENTGENTGTLTYTYDVTGNNPNVEKSVLELTFTSMTAGTFVYTYTESGSVVVSPSEETIALGNTLQLTAEAFDESGHAVAEVEFSWESSDAAVATVDASGLVTGVAVGTATITASAGSGQGTAEITVMDLERAALVALYEATDGPNWVNSNNWLTDAPLGDWYGVDVDGRGRVVRLDLSGRVDEAGRSVSHGLSGPIPGELADLAGLTELWLHDNELSGPIPGELGNLARLESLRLTFNDLSGPIPSELGSLARLERLEIGFNELSGPIPGELGNLSSLWRLALYENDLTGPIPPELANLLSLTQLWLRDNDLTGPIPPELANLIGLTQLDLSSNDLTGPIPHSFLQLDRLRQFFIGGNGSLCVPGTSSFVAWLQGIENASGPYCNEADAAALETLYNASGGADWTNSSRWLETPALDEWYGVTADALGRVVSLDLSRNGLAGRLPGSLGELAHMTELRIAGNTGLSGRLPLSLAGLSLRALHYAGTELCAPVDTSFQAWLNAIPSHEGTGAECAPPSDRDILVALYEATGGPYWVNSSNWLTKAPLQDWHGVAVDGEGRVSHLSLRGNGLRGPIPRELGSLTSLTVLSLTRNQLSGPIPPELGNLASLTTLELGGNALEGPIPPELGNLASLTHLYLWENELSGRIPGELGLTSLRQILLPKNKLSGPIPPELGNLSSLSELVLNENRLTGPIPPELGNLTRPRKAGSVSGKSLPTCR